MPNRFRRELGLILAWLLFPLVPVVSADLYYQVSNLEFTGSPRVGPDPHVWGWFTWVIMLGPLVGYGFLAGATVSVPDDEPAPSGRVRRLLGRRAVWVAIGPWWGAGVCAGCFFGLLYLERLFPGVFSWAPQFREPWTSTWAFWFASRAITILVVAIWAYSWLWPARSALRRAARLGQLKRSFLRGAAVAVTFVASLFGSFWAATSVWRSYFFDPRIVPLVLAGLGLAILSGCSSTITYGEVRRRELFHAMLVAWVLGLALMWRWWSRPRPGGSTGTTG